MPNLRPSFKTFCRILFLITTSNFTLSGFTLSDFDPSDSIPIQLPFVHMIAKFPLLIHLTKELLLVVFEIRGQSQGDNNDTSWQPNLWILLVGGTPR